MLSKTSSTSPTSNLDSGFFLDLAADAVAQFFAQLEHSSGNRPFAAQRFGIATDKQDAAGLHDDGADANDGMFGIVAFHLVPVVG